MNLNMAILHAITDINSVERVAISVNTNMDA